MANQLKAPKGQQQVDQTKSRELSRRDAMTAIARFSAYVAPTTYILLDSKSAFAQACSGTPGGGGTPPGQGGTPQGQGGNPPGQGGTPPGQC